MCEKCDEMDKRIEHYRLLAVRVLDAQTLDGIQKLIAELEDQKAKLHLEQRPSREQNELAKRTDAPISKE
jgi:hypothetical protein